jgi:hypothetical protein
LPESGDFNREDPHHRARSTQGCPKLRMSPYAGNVAGCLGANSPGIRKLAFRGPNLSTTVVPTDAPVSISEARPLRSIGCIPDVHLPKRSRISTLSSTQSSDGLIKHTRSPLARTDPSRTMNSEPA